MMQNFLLPTNNDEFVMAVAKSIAQTRLTADSASMAAKVFSINTDNEEFLDKLRAEFEKMWTENNTYGINIQEKFKQEAIAAINTINLYLLTSGT